MSFILDNELNCKYNWVDIKTIAEDIFIEYEYELRWVEDAWNILMFNTAVKEKNIVCGKLNDYQRGDMIIWILTLYKFCHDFKCIIEFETVYFDHDIGISSYGTFRSLDLMDKIKEIENGANGISMYLYNDVFNKLNEDAIEGKVPKQLFYDIENKCFSFAGEKYEIAYHSERIPDDDSVAKQVLLEEIKIRREYFNNIVLKYFKFDEPKIVDFLTGYRWVEEYSDYNSRRQTIERAYSFKRKTFIKDGNDVLRKYANYKNDDYKCVEEIDEAMNEELENLKYEYIKVAIGYDEVDYEDDTGQKIISWILNGLYEL